MDAYVESEVVRPLKTYVSGHTTVNMCQRIMGNIDLLKSCCSAYQSKESFDVHHTVHHSEKSQLPDQVKAAWFSVTKRFFDQRGRKEVRAIPIGKKGIYDARSPVSLLIHMIRVWKSLKKTLNPSCTTVFQISGMIF